MIDQSDTKDPQKLIALAKAGDEEAFSALYELYFTPLYRYVYVRVHRREEVEDLVQTVFLKVYKSLSSYRSQGKDPLAFFYTVARNAIIDHQRKRTETLGDTAEAIEEVADTAADGNGLALDRHERKRIHDALRQLSEDQRDVITLKFIHDRTNQEIAEHVGKTEVAVRQLQSRGLRALRTILEQHHDGQ